MKKEIVLSALKALGFMPVEIEGIGYRFEYEGLNLLYPTGDDDSDYLTLVVPNIFDITDENRVEVLEAMTRLCGRMKYVQPSIVFGNQVWLNYHHYVGEGEATPDIIEHMVRVLDFATLTFHKIINGEDNEE